MFEKFAGRIVILFLVSLFFLSGCPELPETSGLVPLPYEVELPEIEISELDFYEVGDDTLKATTKEIARLPMIEVEGQMTFERYTFMADNFNTLIDVLNSELEMDLPVFGKTMADWKNMSNVITKFTPLIENYNEVVGAAKQFDENNPESRERFLLAAAVFGFEATLIVSSTVYKAAFEIVGTAFRASGLTAMAFKCPTCVKTVLSTVHWSLREVMVDTGSDVAREVFSLIFELSENPEKCIELLGNYATEKIDSTVKEVGDYLP